MKNVSGKVVDKIKTHILYSVTFFIEYRAFCEIMWKSFVDPGRPQMIKWIKRLACWRTKATNTHTQYVILTAFPLQQLLQKMHQC